MKHLYLSIVALLLSQSLFAQFILTETNHGPVVGVNPVYHTSYPNDIDPDLTGEDYTWDFSGIIDNGDPAPRGFLEPSSVSPFTTATSYRLKIISLGGPKDYYSSDEDGIYIVGEEDATGREYHYTDPIDFLVFPFSYGDSYVDQFIATSEYTETLSFQKEGTYSVSVDGYGDLILPNGTIENIMRIKSVLESDLTLIETEGKSMILEPSIQTRYDWYHQDMRVPVLSYIVTGENADIKTTQYIAASEIIGLSIVENNMTSQLFYPNPSSKQIIINTELQEFTIINMEGRVVKSVLDKASGFVSISDLSKGIYIVKMIDQSDHIFTEKLIIQ